MSHTPCLMSTEVLLSETLCFVSTVLCLRSQSTFIRFLSHFCYLWNETSLREKRNVSYNSNILRQKKVSKPISLACKTFLFLEYKGIEYQSVSVLQKVLLQKRMQICLRTWLFFLHSFLINHLIIGNFYTYWCCKKFCWQVIFSPFLTFSSS